MANILCVAAHPDDETLGCGGALARHVKAGDRVGVIVVADGVSSRAVAGSDNTEALGKRRAAAGAALDCLGVEWRRCLDFPDNRLDGVELLDIIQRLEPLIDEFQPELLYTHHGGDLNIDHRVTHQAVMTACRPLPGTRLRRLLSCEVLSSTEWQSPNAQAPFRPNYFVDISACLAIKLRALSCYGDELREFPHSRSLRAVEHLAAVRGSCIGVAAAEAFMVERIIA